ncbi:hypothetical protein [Streptomyces sp. CBMA152]|uniref:hypothetical protein n=1 Tax=Streptomyces sp. CBMA152 TaxID=1896312 RepID=UPI0016616996|nr:hypothetical protein [Streptomyces sp. CBMA152]MBD0746103.1 hypothetical protein [Streptomyces sp. CBMA152]
MDTRNGEVNLVAKPDWIPSSGFQLRKAGVYFDAVRVDGDDGRRVADALEPMTGGDPGPIVAEATGRRGIYFLVTPRSTSLRSWPPGVTCFNAAAGRISYVPVPALRSRTWPLSWRCPPSEPDRFVHTMLLLSVVRELLAVA